LEFININVYSDCDLVTFFDAVGRNDSPGRRLFLGEEEGTDEGEQIIFFLQNCGLKLFNVTDSLFAHIFLLFA
jgi:hypothetical protein